MFFPPNHFYTLRHLWLRPIGKQDVYVGVTDYAQKESGRIGMIELLPEGKKRETEESFGLLYGSNKSIELLMPFNGRVLITNQEIIQNPFLINVDPYNYWIAVISLKEKEISELPFFLSSKEYVKAILYSENV